MKKLILKTLNVIFFLSNSVVYPAEQHRYKKVMIIKRFPDGGFFSNFFCMLAGIEKAENNGYLPVIDMQTIDLSYKNPVPVNGIKNAWEYFFYQPAGINLEQAFLLNRKPIILNVSEPIQRALTILPLESNMLRIKNLIKKYIHVKEDIQKLVHEKFPNGFDKTVLGVHVRGSDRRRGCPFHLMTADAHQYLKKAIELDDQNKFSKIFLACDEIETIEAFKTVFGDRLMYNDAYRVSAYSIESVHQSRADPRPYHKYLLGKEVLLDCLMLSYCGHFILGPSNVSHAAIFFSESTQNFYPIESPGLYQP